MSKPTAPTVFLPDPPERWDRAFMSRALESIKAALSRCLSKETANDGIMLRSPSGKVFNVTVSDAGALTVTYISG